VKKPEDEDKGEQAANSALQQNESNDKQL